MSSQESLREEEIRLSRRYARFVMNNRRIIFAIVALTTLLAAFQIHKLDIRNDPDTLLPPSNRYVATNAYAESHFGMGNMMVVGVEIKEGDIYQPWFINMVQEIHQKMADLPTSRPENFLSLAAQKVKYMGTDENGLIFKRLIPTEGVSLTDEELASQQLQFLKRGLEENPVMAPMLLHGEDGAGNRCQFSDGECTAKAAFIIGDYTDGVKEIYVPWVEQVLELLAPYSKDERVEILVAGEPYFLAYMMLELKKKWWLFAISIAIVILILFKEFGNLRRAVIPLVGVSATIITTLGLMGFSQFKLTTMMVLTPMLLLAIGIGHAVQITRRHIQEREEGASTEEAGANAIAHTIVPASLSIVTDVAGFATLSLVDISFYKAYAYFGMFGMFTLLITTTTLIPLLLVTFPDRTQDPDTVTDQKSAETNTLGVWLAELLTGPKKWLPAALVALILLVSTYYTGIIHGTQDDLMPGVEKGINYARAAFKEESITIKHITRLSEIMPGVISLSVPIRGKEPIKPLCEEMMEDVEPPLCHDSEEMGAQGIFNKAEVIADIVAMEEWMRNHPYIGFTGSYAQYIRLVNMLMSAEPGEKVNLADLTVPTRAAMLAVDPEDDRNPDEIISMYNGLLETMTSAGELSAFVNNQTWNEGVVLGFVNTMDPKKTHQTVADIQAYIEKHKNDPGFSQVHFGLRNQDTSGDTNHLSKPGPDYIAPGIGGFLGATEATWEVSIKEWLRGPLQTATAIFVIGALMFRSLAISGMLVSVLLITLFAQYGLAGYFTATENWSGNLHFANLVALSIAMGLGVDYSIYIIFRLREEMASTNQNWKLALTNTLSSTGSAVIASVIVLLGSFIPLVSTELGNTWGLGMYIGEAIIIDVFTALTFLPLMIWLFKPAYVFGKKQVR
ncbi:MAG: MMPL family transporter [Magnetococcales bacterium]|nr:MMPL family transporter [Magnetococcales bacterium]